MLINLFKFIIKNILFFILYFFISITHTFADKINNFKITGNDRISNETIILFSGYKINDDLNDNDLNEL